MSPQGYNTCVCNLWISSTDWRGMLIETTIPSLTLNMNYYSILFSGSKEFATKTGDAPKAVSVVVVAKL